MKVTRYGTDLIIYCFIQGRRCKRYTKCLERLVKTIFIQADRRTIGYPATKVA